VNLTLVVVAKDQADLRAFDLTHVNGVHLVLLSNEAREPLSAIGNRYLDRSSAPVFGLVHADCWFGPESLAAFTAAALSGHVAGIVGVSLPNMRYQWCHENPSWVSTLDSCSVFFRRDLGVRFDEQTFDGLHCHVEDICLQARARGLLVSVPPADARHRSATANGQAWLDDYCRYRQRLAEKWRGVAFATT
jgi:hypothetical protein